MYESDVTECPRCGKAHKKVKFEELTHPSAEHNYWASCPDNREPILARVALVTTPFEMGKPDNGQQGEAEPVSLMARPGDASPPLSPG